MLPQVRTRHKLSHFSVPTVQNPSQHDASQQRLLKTYQRSPVRSTCLHPRNKQTHPDVRAWYVFLLSMGVRLLPNEIVSMQPLRLHTWTDFHRRCCRKNGIRRKNIRHISRPMVWFGDCAQEAVEDLLQGWLLQPNLSCCGATPEKACAACRFWRKRL